MNEKKIEFDIMSSQYDGTASQNIPEDKDQYIKMLHLQIAELVRTIKSFTDKLGKQAKTIQFLSEKVDAKNMLHEMNTIYPRYPTEINA